MRQQINKWKYHFNWIKHYISPSLVVIITAFSAYLVYQQNYLMKESKRPFLAFTPKIIVLPNNPQMIEAKIVVGNYGEGSAIIDEFKVQINGQTYQSNYSSKWREILSHNQISHSCPLSEGWLIKNAVLKAGDEEDNFLRLVYPMAEVLNGKEPCIMPFIDLIKAGKLTLSVKYHSIYNISYSQENIIEYDFSALQEQFKSP